MPLFMKSHDAVLFDWYSLATTAGGLMGALTNVEACEDLKILTSIFDYIFGDVIWSVR